jgi:hypothetical protein
MHNQKSSKLEWIIIVLLSAEIVVMSMDLFEVSYSRFIVAFIDLRIIGIGFKQHEKRNNKKKLLVCFHTPRLWTCTTLNTFYLLQCSVVFLGKSTGCHGFLHVFVAVNGAAYPAS